MKRPIFIHYETKVREFDGKLLLISHLLKQFDKVYFGSFAGIQREALCHNNGIIIFKSISKVKIPFYDELKRRGFILILLHAEGGFYYKEDKDILKSLYNSELLEYIDLNFLFGETIKKNILELCGEKFDNKTIVSGEPRFDLLKPKYRGFFEKIVSSIKKQHGDFILINTDFPLVNSYVGNNKLFEYLLSEPTYSEGFRQGIIKKAKILSIVISSFLDAIKYISGNYPNLDFIIRPHPSESEQFYTDQFKGIHNVYVSKKHNVASWILASRGVIHYDCTTGMEAALAGKPVISFLPEKDDDLLVWLPVELSKKVFTKEELSFEITNIINGSFENEISASAMNAWEGVVHNVKHESSEIILKTLQEKIGENNNTEVSFRSSKVNLFLKRLRHNVSFIKRKLLVKESDDHSRHKFGCLNKREVASKIKYINNISNSNLAKIIVNKPAVDVVIIKKKSP